MSSRIIIILLLLLLLKMKARCVQYVHIIHIYVFVHPLLSPFLLPALLWSFLPFHSFTHCRFIVSNVRSVRLLLPYKCENWERKAIWCIHMVRSVSMLNFLCAFTMLLPFKVCFMHYIWTHCVHTYIPYSSTYSDIEKYCYRT